MTYKPEPCKVLEVKKITSDMSLIKVKAKLNIEPGRFIQVSVLGYGEAAFCPTSFENHIELVVRDVGTLTHALCNLKKNDLIFIRGPYGKGYPMHQFKDNNIIAIAGGTGLVPIRSVLYHIEKNRSDFREVYVFLGFRSPEEVLFKEDIKRWQKKFNLILTIDKPAINWDYKVGLIPDIVRKSNLNNVNKIVSICGPPIMIKFTLEKLKEMGFDNDQIFISYERRMECGLGRCGRCMIHGKYVCRDGPVFRYDELAKYEND